MKFKETGIKSISNYVKMERRHKLCSRQYLLCIFLPVCILYLIYVAVTRDSIVNTGVIEKPVIIHWTDLKTNLFCHYEVKDDALPSAEDPNVSLGSNSIFFHETSCRGGINSRQACAVESAARLHPNRQVNLLFSSPVTKIMLRHSCLLKLIEFKNVKLSRLHVEQYSLGTVVEKILSKDIKNSSYPIEHVSDILRIVTLYKFGGLYLDTDSILVKNLDSLPSNWIAKESNEDISSGIIALSKDDFGTYISIAILKCKNRQVNLLFSSPVTKIMLRHSCLLKLIEFKNVKLSRLHVEQYSLGTVVEKILSKDIKNSSYPIEHVSDILRIVTLYKFGGLYLDTDSILVKNLDSLPSNWIAKESNEDISSGIIALSKDDFGTYISIAILKEIHDTYQPTGWSTNGPKAIQRALQRLCPQTLTKADHCKELKIFPPKNFYPIAYSNHTQYFKNGNISDTEEVYMHHMWNYLTRNLKIEKGSPFAKLARKFCPTIYEMYGDEFGV